MKQYNYYKDFVKAVFQMDADRFFALVESCGIPDGILEDCGAFPDVAFPLHYITICWDIVMHEVYDDITETDRPKEYILKKGNDRIKEYFATQHHLNMEAINFRDFGKYFYIYCFPFEEFQPEDILDDTMENLLKAGYRKKDIELYYYADTFDFEKVESLLKDGADPKFTFEGDEQCLDRIGAEAAFLSTLIAPGDSRDNFLYECDEIMGNLIGYAAHEKMYSLLLKYCHKTGY